MGKPNDSYEAMRETMVERHIAARGIHDERILNAFRVVPREAFLPEDLREFAYEDSPLPIADGQTISQPYIVALMIDALGLKGGEKVLEVGAGSGYAAAVIAQIADEVYTIERLQNLVVFAKSNMASLGYENVHVLHGDGTRGWQEQAPYDAIVVAAGGPDIPESLKSQLKISGRLVIPVGADPKVQELVRVVRRSNEEFITEDIADVRFVPLLGAEGWVETDGRLSSVSKSDSSKAQREDDKLGTQIKATMEPFASIDSCDLEPMLQRIGDSRVVLIGEASHGTSEFYRFRARLTKQLIEQKGFSFVSIEGDWPDAARIDHYVRHFEFSPSEWVAFARFPTWMWRNHEVRDFVDWLRLHNAGHDAEHRIAFYGLDLYSLFSSIRSILKYLDTIDPDTAAAARQRYGCLTPWQSDPASYGHAALTGKYKTCEKEVVDMLATLLEKSQRYTLQDGERYLDAIQNARLIANAERYYRVMYYGSRESWNLRDSHMFETLETMLNYHGPHSKAVVWAHNSHVGDAAATEMSARGEHNIGHLCRKAFGEKVYSIGFGTNDGTVAAASDWDGPLEIMKVRPAMSGSVERLCHETSVSNFLLPLAEFRNAAADEALNKPRLERAIGVIYRPETEYQSHYFQTVLPYQFDEYVWFDSTEAVHPIDTLELEGLPDTYPFGL